MRALGWVGIVAVASVVACTDLRDDRQPTTSVASTVSTTNPSGSEGASTGSSSAAEGQSGSADGSTTGEKLDIGAMAAGCDAIDMLFVIDNSSSMQTYQSALGAQFPAFIDAMFTAVPPDIDIHVGITTTDFDSGCSAAEAPANCQTGATLDEVLMHYNPPTDGSDGGNGSQGRLFEYSGQRWFELSSSDDPAPLSEWFTQAATAAGESGCTFEMPIAAAGFATHPANDDTNAGFLRDEGALLVVFFLTDEPDKSPESETVYADMILEAKAGCGGADCVFVSGLAPTCIVDANQKLWQFMEVFRPDPPFGDILDTAHYDEYVGSALATAVAEACANIPVG